MGLTGWPTTVAEAEAVQLRLRALVQPDGDGAAAPETVAGLDVAYGPDRVAGAVVVLDATTMDVLDSATAAGPVSFPYVPGLLAFRELPPLLSALDSLPVRPDVLLCDGYGLAHPRRFGLACHLGVHTGLSTIGIAKTPFTTAYEPPGPQRGDWSDLTDGDEVLGRVLRTRTHTKPVFVSVGHRVNLDDACALVLRLCRGYRLPETTRLADRLSRQALSR